VWRRQIGDRWSEVNEVEETKEKKEKPRGVLQK